MSLKISKQTEKLKQIAISNENYDRLKQLGHAGDSFNDVITDVLKRIGVRTKG